VFPTDSRSDNDRQTPFARGEIECLCIMQAIGRDGCTLLELAARLGLADALTEAVSETVSPLFQQGRIEMREDRLRLTEAGQSCMHERLAASA